MGQDSKTERSEGAPKHTPGPWHVDQDPRGDMQWNRSVDASDGGTVCFMAHGWGADRDEANARLIAAAPELLEMAECLQAVCARVIEQYGPVQCGVDFAALGGSVNRVIAKATGSAP